MDKNGKISSNKRFTCIFFIILYFLVTALSAKNYIEEIIASGYSVLFALPIIAVFCLFPLLLLIFALHAFMDNNKQRVDTILALSIIGIGLVLFFAFAFTWGQHEAP